MIRTTLKPGSTLTLIHVSKEKNIHHYLLLSLLTLLPLSVFLSLKSIRLQDFNEVTQTQLSAQTNSLPPFSIHQNYFEFFPSRADAYMFETLWALKMWFNRKSSTKQTTHSPFHFFPVCWLVLHALRDGTKAHSQSTNDSQNIGRNPISQNPVNDLH